MGTKNKKKGHRAPIYIAPPTKSKLEEFTVVDYDPQTKIHDPFEDDLEFLLKADQDVQSTSINVSKTEKVSVKDTKVTSKKSKNGKSVTPEPNDVKITKKVKKEIMDFDITFSSDESDNEEDIGTVVRGVDSEMYLKAELGLESSDSDLNSSDADDVEDFYIMTELYEKLALSEKGDDFQNEHFDEEDMSDFEGYSKAPTKNRFESQKSKKAKTPNQTNNSAPKIKAKKKSLLQNSPEKSNNTREKIPDGAKNIKKKGSGVPKKGNNGKKLEKSPEKEDIKPNSKSQLLDQKKNKETKESSSSNPKPKNKKKEKKDKVTDQKIEPSDKKPVKTKKKPKDSKDNGGQEQNKSIEDTTIPKKKAPKKKKSKNSSNENTKDQKGQTSDKNSKPKIEGKPESQKNKLDALQATIDKRMVELKKMKDESLPHIL